MVKYSSFTPQSEKWLRKSERLFKQAEDLRKERKYKKAKEIEREAEELRARGLEAREQAKIAKAKKDYAKATEQIQDAAVLPSITDELWEIIKHKCNQVERAIRKRKDGNLRGINVRLKEQLEHYDDTYMNYFEAFREEVRMVFETDEHFFEVLAKIEEDTGYDLADNDYWFGSNQDLATVSNNVTRAISNAKGLKQKEAKFLEKAFKLQDEILEEYPDINSEFMD